MSYIPETGMIRLDFGEHGSLDVPPYKALSLVSDEAVRTRIRQEVMKARAQTVTLVEREQFGLASALPVKSAGKLVQGSGV